MLEIKVMPVSQFLQTGSDGDEAELEKMYKLIRENTNGKDVRLDYGVMPLYTCDDRIYGVGDCVKILSHRKGYGYTIISVGDRGSWICSFHCESKNYNDIAFYNGTFEEVYERPIRLFEFAI